MFFERVNLLIYFDTIIYLQFVNQIMCNLFLAYSSIRRAILDVLMKCTFGIDFSDEEMIKLNKLHRTFGNGVLGVPFNLPFTAYGKVGKVTLKVHSIRYRKKYLFCRTLTFLLLVQPFIHYTEKFKW